MTEVQVTGLWSVHYMIFIKLSFNGKIRLKYYLEEPFAGCISFIGLNSPDSVSDEPIGRRSCGCAGAEIPSNGK